MKTIRLILAIIAVATFTVAEAQNIEKEKSAGEKIEVWYFHYTARCMTCRTVEERAMENLQDLYPARWKAGTITFKSADLNEKEGEALAKKLGVSGQTLMIAKGKKQINITNEAFLYAVTNPEKYKKVIREKVDELLE